jgi:chromate transporter
MGPRRHTEVMEIERDRKPTALGAVAAVFLKLGVIGFGGPAAHIALMRQEVVGRRGWLSDGQFLDLVGATNLIPGPNSTEMAMHVGRERAGWRGLVVAGTAFIGPAALMVLGLAWAYVEYGSTPGAESLLYGIEPVVMAIIVHAVWQLGRTAIRGPLTAAVGACVVVLYLLGVNELLLLASSAVLVSVISNRERVLGRGSLALFPLLAVELPHKAGQELGGLFLLFLKFGAVVFGSGYVLLAFLRGDLVVRLGWLTSAQLADAVSVGQFTPGPVFTTATFIGYVVGGLPGALLATLGIFLPSFFLVGALNPLIPYLRGSPWAGTALDGLNVAALGLMAGVSLQLGRAALVDAVTVVLALAALVVLFRWRPNPAWVVLAGAVVGVARWALS